ncbi:MAG: D-glycerate dehydrogenase, partial [Cytophagaceae bacterium]|nr:D-glycerate dehydrogenase [Gemmatimonadaceae bacterium]
WRPTHLLGTRVSGKALGIVGMGRIGRAVARRAGQGFGMRVSYWSRTRLPEAEERVLGVSWRPTLDTLVSGADFVTLHCPATPETRHLIDAAALRQFRPHAFLVNTARGDVVDEAALLEAMNAGTIAGAALDVFDGEPSVNPAILARPDIVTLPHLGSATVESRVAMGERALRNITAFVEGVEPPDRVV